MMHTWQGNYVSLDLHSDEVAACAHSGRCDDDVEATLRFPYVADQLDAMDPNDIRLELKPWGAWDAAELEDDAANRARLVWLAAGSIRDEG